MSRIGKQPVVLPTGVKASVSDGVLSVQGPKGRMERRFRSEVDISLVDGALVFNRSDDSKSSRAFHGLERSLANNMVIGVSRGFEKQLELVGVGYRAEMNGRNLKLALGYSHDIDFVVPDGVECSIVKENRDMFIKVEGVDKQLVGEVAARIRSLRAPEPYKGKGVRYRGEVVKRKAGKAGKK